MKDNTPKTVEEILDSMLDKQVLVNKIGQQPFDEAKQQLYQLMMDVVGKDDRHDNGHIMINDPSTCMDCTNPDKRFARNTLRFEQRTKLNELFGVKK